MFFIFFPFRFSSLSGLLSKRGAKVRRFFRLSQGLSKFNSLGLCWADTGNTTRMAAVKLLRCRFSVAAVAVAEPDVRLTIWDCKSRGIFWVYKEWWED